MGNIVKFVRVGVRLFFGDESGFSSGYLEFEVLFLFMHARFVYHRHFFCFFDGHFFDFTWGKHFLSAMKTAGANRPSSVFLRD